jgi:hypothetical protein
VQAGIERMRQVQEHMWKLVADGSAWEVELARRGVLDEGALEIAWGDAYGLRPSAPGFVGGRVRRARSAPLRGGAAFGPAAPPGDRADKGMGAR